MDNGKETASRLTMLGTGNALVTKCYNTCFVLDDGGTRLLVDAGGGNGVLAQLERAGIPLQSIHEMFLTHAHTDHILGAVWVVRLVMQLMRKGSYEGRFTVRSHGRALQVLESICRMTLPAKLLALMGDKVVLEEVAGGQDFLSGSLPLTCFDIGSTKEKQYGFRARLSGGKTLVCLGDEPFNPANRAQAEGADWLLCEAFCTYADREVFKPYEKRHSTAFDAGRVAEELHARRLLLYHTEDKHLATRRAAYTAEAKACFTGQVFVPDDLEVIAL